MAFGVLHDVDKGVRQLLGAPADLADWVAEDQGRPRAPHPPHGASPSLLRRSIRAILPESRGARATG